MATSSKAPAWKAPSARPGSARPRKGWSSGRSAGPSLPEGDTIWRTAAALRRRLAGQLVREARPAAIARLKGRRLEAVDANGKHLLMRFEGGMTLHSHLRMTGAWHPYRPGEPWRQPERRATAVLTFPETVAVCFAAPLMELVVDERRAVGHLGPDILVDPFDLDEVIRRARR